MTTENLTIADLELMSNKLSALISQYANDMSRVRFAHTSGYDDEARYAARIFRENHGDILDLRDKLSDIIRAIKRESVDKIADIEVPVQAPTARYKTQIKTFYNSASTSEINAFLNNPDIIYVDLKIEKSGCVIVYKTIVYD